MISEETFTVVLLRPLAIGEGQELRSMVLMPRDDGFGGVVALREVTLVVVQVVGVIVVLVLSFLNGRKRRAVRSQRILEGKCSLVHRRLLLLGS